MPISILRRVAVCTLLASAFIAGGAGCAFLFGTVVVDVELDVEISGRDAAGNVWHAEAREFSKRRHPQSVSPFPNVHYEGHIFEWRIVAGQSSLGYFIRSRVAGLVCFRFDQAQLSSNFYPSPIPLRVKGYLLSGDDTCFSAEKGGPVGMDLVLTDLFPSGQLFNINQSGHSTAYSETGVGNWLKITVPIEYLGKREIVDVTLTARESRARRRLL